MKLENLLIYLPEGLSRAIIRLQLPQITELRLRADGPVSVTCLCGNVTFDKNGKPCNPHNAITLSSSEIEECVTALCKRSRYSFEEYIKNGFIPLDDGARAGVCGKALVENGKITSFSQITSINIRLNVFLPDIAKETATLMKSQPCGIAVYSPPGYGKTTYLKSLIHLLSIGKFSPAYRVGVIDERFELSDPALKKGLCDVISGCSKSVGIELLTRTMSSEIIICDEVSKSDEDAIISGCNAGASFICSFHGATFETVMKRSFVANIVNAGIFKYALGIEKRDGEYKYKVTSI